MVVKCKKCGSNVRVADGQETVVCEVCGIDLTNSVCNMLNAELVCKRCGEYLHVTEGKDTVVCAACGEEYLVPISETVAEVAEQPEPVKPEPVKPEPVKPEPVKPEVQVSVDDDEIDDEDDISEEERLKLYEEQYKEVKEIYAKTLLDAEDKEYYDLTESYSYNNLLRKLDEISGYKDADEMFKSLPVRRKEQREKFAEYYKKMRAYDVKDTVGTTVFFSVITAVLAGVIALLFAIFKWEFNWTVAQWLISIGGGLAFVLPIVLFAFIQCDEHNVVVNIIRSLAVIANLVFSILFGQNYAIICYGFSIIFFLYGIIRLIEGNENRMLMLFTSFIPLVAVASVVIAINDWSIGQWFASIAGGIALLCFTCAIARLAALCDEYKKIQTCGYDDMISDKAYSATTAILSALCLIANAALMVLLGGVYKVVFVGVSSAILLLGIFSSLRTNNVGKVVKTVIRLEGLLSIALCVLGLIFF